MVKVGILQRVETRAEFKYKVITVPDTDAVNCMFINGTLVHRLEFNGTNKVSHYVLSNLNKMSPTMTVAMSHCNNFRAIGKVTV